MPHSLSPGAAASQPPCCPNGTTATTASTSRSWFRDGYFLTNDKAYLDAEVLRGIFDSDLMWWNKPMDVDAMRQMLDNCMVFSVYAVPDTESEMQTLGRPRSADIQLVGFARLVTDSVTFAYLTDVFVLEDHQRRGLAGWMMRGIREVLAPWPYLRGLVLMTENEKKAGFYRRELGAVNLQDGPSKGLVLLEMPGKAEVAVPEGAVVAP